MRLSRAWLLLLCFPPDKCIFFKRLDLGLGAVASFCFLERASFHPLVLPPNACGQPGLGQGRCRQPRKRSRLPQGREGPGQLSHRKRLAGCQGAKVGSCSRAPTPQLRRGVRWS